MRKIFLAVATALAMFSCSQKEPVTVTITNPLSIDRNGEMVEISMAEITGKLQLPDTAQVIVLDENGLEVPYQITYDDMLIFPVSVKGGASVTYTIAEGTPQPVDVVACGRQYPERLDDVAWENDRAAYRAYGPALQEKGERAFGYDIWTKNVPEPVVEDRYDGDLNQGISYHIDHGTEWIVMRWVRLWVAGQQLYSPIVPLFIPIVTRIVKSWITVRFDSPPS